MRWIPIAALALLPCAARTAHAAAWQCGTPVPPGATVTLSGDTECGLVHLGGGATFDLAGHTFTGLLMGPEDGRPSRFTVLGPGEIHAQYPDNPCVMFYAGSVLIDGGSGRITLTRCGYGVLANVGGSRLALRRVTLRRAVDVPMSLGAQAAKVELQDVIIDHSQSLDPSRGHGVSARKITGSGITLQHLNNGLSAPVIRVSDVVADDVTAALANARRVDATGLVSTRHSIGVFGKKVRLTASTLANARPGGTDVGAATRPVLVDTACERSGRYDPLAPGLVFAPPWGVCALD